jgi:hypothetical protein
MVSKATMNEALQYADRLASRALASREFAQGRIRFFCALWGRTTRMAAWRACRPGMPTARSISWIAAWALTLVGCGNSSEQVAAVHTAADAYCACVQAQLDIPLDQVRLTACDAENAAFHDAWETLRKPGDDSVQKLFGLVSSCRSTLSEADDHAEEARELRRHSGR